MRTVLFVAGTGVREGAYADVFDRVRRELWARQPGLAVEKCYWGHLGSQLHGGGLSIPAFQATGGEVQPTAAHVASATWEVISEDALFEFRALALRGPSVGSMALGRLPPGEALLARLRDLVPNATLAHLLERAEIADLFDRARAEVGAAPACREALRAAGEALGEYRAALARAVCARAAILARLAEREPTLDFDPHLRTALVAALAEALGGEDKAIVGTVTRLLSGFASRLATPMTQRYRGSLSGIIQPFLGDILLYQAAGETIREFLQRRIAALPGEVVFLAHSLGGVACVDLLIQKPLPQVVLLATVGSQAPLLYELNSLTSLRYGQVLPEHFPRWLNVYDRRDFLSYVGAGVFPGRVRDVLVDNQASFPSSHGAYWTNPETWAALLSALK